jgi:hypothetical protein
VFSWKTRHCLEHILPGDPILILCELFYKCVLLWKNQFCLHLCILFNILSPFLILFIILLLARFNICLTSVAVIMSKMSSFLYP